MKTHTLEQKDKALKYYLIGLSLTEISKLIDIPIRTLEKWQTQNKWTEQKSIENIKLVAYQLNEAGKTHKEIGDLLKISKATVLRYIKAAKAMNE